MANNNNASVAVAASGAGASTDIRLYAPPFTFTFIGATGDGFRYELSGENSGWVQGTERILTANDEGEACFTITENANYIRCYTTEGNSGATATASVTGQPLTANKPSATLTVNNDATPGAWTDCRTIGGPRTILYEGFSGDVTYIEGSDDGATNPYQVYPASGSTGRSGATYAATIDKIPNYMRVVRPSGTTAGARCVVVGPNNATAGATGDVVNGGQAGAVTVGSSNVTTAIGLTTGTTTTMRAGTDLTIAAGTGVGGEGSVSITSAGGGDVNVTSADDMTLTANGNMTVNVTDGLAITAGATGTRITSTGGVGIGGVPLASAVLNLDSTAKGFLPPRMNTAQRTAIVAPATGLKVYDTDLGCECQYDGANWTFNLSVYARNTSAPAIADGTGPVDIGNWTVAASLGGAAFNAATGVFTAPFQGVYTFIFSAELAAIAFAISTEFAVSIALGGAEIARGNNRNQVGALSQLRSAQCQVSLLLNAADEITFRAEQDSGSGAGALTATATRNYLSISVSR